MELGYIKTVLKGIKGIYPNDIYLDENRIIIPFISGSNVSKIRETIHERLKNTWMVDYIQDFKLNQGFFTITLKDNSKKEKEMTESIYKPKLILQAYELEAKWYKSLGLPLTDQADEIMLFIIENDEIKDTKLVDRKTFKDYKPQDNEYYLDRVRDSGDVLIDYNLEPAQKLVDLWNDTFFKTNEIVESLNDVINEALEIPVVKDYDLKLPIDELVIRQYDKHHRYGTDWITEYNYVTKEELTKEQFDKIIDAQENKPYGQIEYHKKRLTYANGEVYYRHILKAIMY